MPSNRFVPRSGILALALAFAVAACAPGLGGSGGMGMGRGGRGMHDSGAGSAGDEIRDDADVPTPFVDARRVEVEAGELYFEPARLEIAAGERVNLVVSNRGQVFHDLAIAELDLLIEVPAGETATAGVRVDDPGAYIYVCTVAGHESAGMTGTLVVTDG